MADEFGFEELDVRRPLEPLPIKAFSSNQKPFQPRVLPTRITTVVDLALETLRVHE
jgi:hypothetical protein